ncbi:hypothetical protein OG342_21695 [Streptomyces bobili]|uniref:hypothetical protein n=1 Tax=Streptomyces bobili TaxID=67280 RepID=UPI0022536F32|nr:hypothetical protein [Streptomyces bobili]MCX5525434.1 hypothetical protein [Streptomyces bobili]
MAHADDLLADIAARVESEHNSRMSLTVVIPGAVITGRLAPETLWKQRVAEVLEASDQLAVFSSVFTRPDGTGKPPEPRADRPTHLHFHVARILQGNFGIPDTGGMYRVALEDVSAWTIGDIGYSDH